MAGANLIKLRQVNGAEGYDGEIASVNAGRKDYAALLKFAELFDRRADDDGPSYATTILRRAIVSGALKAGEAIRQDLVGSALSLSKPPVREALRKLEAERLVVFAPNRGFVVAPESSAELREAFEVRVVLEPAVLRLAFPHLTARDFEHARDLMHQLETDPDYESHFALNLHFHLALYEPSRRPHFLEAVEQAHVRSQRYIHQILERLGTVKNVADDGRHRKMIEYLELGEIDAACDCLVQHLEVAAESLLRSYQLAAENKNASLRHRGRRRASAV